VLALQGIMGTTALDGPCACLFWSLCHPASIVCEWISWAEAGRNSKRGPTAALDMPCTPSDL